jgi:hypothetical protein
LSDQKVKIPSWNVFRRKSLRAMSSSTARRSRKGNEAEDVTLGPEWTCILGKLKGINDDLRNWPLSALYTAEYDEHGERVPVLLNFECDASVLQEIEDSRAVTFYGGRHLGQEPGGVELFGKSKGKGFDPQMNRVEKSIVADFFRNTDNWAPDFPFFMPNLCVSGPAPCVCEDGTRSWGVVGARHEHNAKCC